MKKQIIAMAMIFGMSLSTAGAAPIVGGGLSDWGIISPEGFFTGDTVGTPTVGRIGNIDYWEEKGVLSDGYVEPGFGGFKYDIMGAYFTTDESKMYFAFITGMGPSGSGINTMGDIAINFGSGYKYGIETLGGNIGKDYDVSQWTNPNSYLIAAPVDILVGAEIAGDTSSLVYDVFTVIDGDTYYYIEAYMDKPADFDPANIVVHLTQTCGNDVVNFHVPEPSTLLLLGSGLVGLGLFGRKRKNA